MKYLIHFIILYFFLPPSVHADWNEQFDTQTAMLLQYVPSLQNPKYLKENQFFINVREILINDPALIKELQEVGMDGKN